jgi:hypothetical protein
LADCREEDEPDLAPRDLVWRDLVDPDERFALAPRRALDDARGFRVGALLEELLRAGPLPLLRGVPDDRPRGRVFVWAMLTHLPQIAPICIAPFEGYGSGYPCVRA